MEPGEVAEELLGALNSGDLDTVASFLADNFQFSGPVPEPIGADQWLGLSGVLLNAFEDLQYNLRVESVEGNIVRIAAQLNGTHNNDLDLSAMGMGVIPASGKTFSLPEEHGEVLIEGDKAVAASRNALSLARRGGQGQLADKIERRLELYQRRQPYRDE